MSARRRPAETDRAYKRRRGLFPHARQRTGEGWRAFRNRKARNRKQCCRCLGWWFPHRIGSKPSDEDAEHGCYR